MILLRNNENVSYKLYLINWQLSTMLSQGIKTIYLEFLSRNFNLVSCYNNLYSRYYDFWSCTDENVFSLFRIAITKFQLTIRIYEMLLVISYCHREISTFDLVFTRCVLVISCYHEISSYNHVYTRYLLVISYCHHEISTLDLVFTRCLLVISCCYHENSTYNHVYTRCLLVISYCHHEISTLDLVFTRCLLVISCCYHEISSFNLVNSRCVLVKTWLIFFYIPDPITLP